MTRQRQPSNKKPYQMPELVTYGTVAEITQAFGVSPAGDWVMIGGSNLSDPIPSTGSRDGIVQMI
jgi:hypothetical protein